MKYYGMGLCLLLMMSGCASTSNKFASENYIVDLESGSFCIEGRFDCRSLSLIQPSFRESWIANAFAMPKQYYSWRGDELAALLLNPPDHSYQAEQVDDQLYRVPPTYATHVVWDVLAMEYYTLYGDDDGDSLLPHGRPQPRRFSVSK
ncbi:hypothetical protein Q4508_19170 [Amphritea sp. 2_MG-2023]|uniref:hypothetical protein n=1 Tax=Amphritea TaxID=515417 RepID=UPI001C076E3D|nr:MULTISPECIES: hypothetical protein [Amphritea]MBU2966789.1 hypothetical protein [Amphritea atlantica]MDO6420680.1 hypothetical protein [Amphritea sp. 2_MG-2023]